jgi:hypothetical protein
VIGVIAKHILSRLSYSFGWVLALALRIVVSVPIRFPMATCPKCQRMVSAKDVNCPSCRTPLKAYGHPGMPIYRATGEEPLCLSCWYHGDDSCTYEKRPLAMECTLYRNPADSLGLLASPRLSWRGMWRRYQGWLLFAALVAIAVLVTVLR